MSPEKYNRVKEIFLAACDRPDGERAAFIEKNAQGDEEIRREVESLLREHVRDTQVMPENPESPMGSMSAILSRASSEIGAEELKANERAEVDVEAGVRSRDPHRRAGDGSPSEYLDDSGSGSRSGFVDAGRFMAGTVAAGRYRIIELLGRGGMGEVYRADDITLNQAVALKFLPAIFGQDPAWLERFKNEVRLARQVTHPNVCRVFDIGEFQGEQFISMEYVDGENLGSLLRRIGRVPHTKGLQIARQLCAGLSAAHDRGVLHRDLKPANVMIDGRGAVRITDFGLAAPTDQLKKDSLRAGTPAYMSPEQLAGRSVTVRSDVYSLGLVLYEMFTGRRAFRGETMRDYQKLHSSEEPTPPSEIVEDIDPIVERVILRCLEKDPKNRPASAIAVSAALPGGNPLREILAAGETPSPEVVAAAGGAHGGMKPKFAAAYLLAGLFCLILVVMLAPRTFVVQRAIKEKQPVVLADKARDALAAMGYTEKPKDSAQGFAVNSAYYVHVQNSPRMTDRMSLLARARPGLISFWYRQSPDVLIPWQPDSAVGENDPPGTKPGMVRVSLDPLGRLIGLEAEPTEGYVKPVRANPPASSSATAPGPSAMDWSPLLAAVGFSDGKFKSVVPSHIPPVFADQRAAWEGSFNDAPDEKLHLEAAAFQGRPVYLGITGGWDEETLSEEKATVLSLGSINLIMQTLVTLFLLCAGSYLAFQNYRSGRADRLGATRMALAFLSWGSVAWALRAHHVADLILEFRMFARSMGSVMYEVGLVWVFYMAMEPYVRRIWPETVISWSRMLAGHWIDPLVGRDVLIGAVVGIFTTLLGTFDRLVPPLMGLPGPMPDIRA